jgi:hypothetical protein
MYISRMTLAVVILNYSMVLYLLLKNSTKKRWGVRLDVVIYCAVGSVLFSLVLSLFLFCYVILSGVELSRVESCIIVYGQCRVESCRVELRIVGSCKVVSHEVTSYAVR